MNQNPPHFGEQVQARITAKGMNLRDFSEVTGIALTTLHRRLHSASMDFKLGELIRVAEALDTTASALVSEYEAAA